MNILKGLRRLLVLSCLSIGLYFGLPKRSGYTPRGLVVINLEDTLAFAPYPLDSGEEIWAKVIINMVQTAEAISSDPNVQAVLVKTELFDLFSIPSEQIWCEFHDCVARMRAAGKKVYIHLGKHPPVRIYDWAPFASADKIYINPGFEAVENYGFPMRFHTYRGFLEKRGLIPRALKSLRTPHKDGAESLSEYRSSEGRKQRAAQLLERWLAAWKKMILGGFEKLSETHFNRLQYQNELEVGELIKLGMLRIKHVEEVEKRLARKYGLGVKHLDYINSLPKNTAAPEIALFSIRGSCFYKGPDNSGLDVDWIKKCVKRIIKDSKIKVVVLDIAGPGGSMVGMVIGEYVKEMKRAGKRVIVSVGDRMIASAHYWMSCAADHIFASHGAQVGSIGVYSLYASDAIQIEDAGVGADLETRGDMIHVALMHKKELTPREQKLAQDYIEKAYMKFCFEVARGRKKSIDEVIKLATGELYSAEEALSHGLIDRIGSLQDALAYARSLAGNSQASVVWYVQRSFKSLLLALLLGLLYSVFRLQDSSHQNFREKLLSSEGDPNLWIKNLDKLV